MKTALEWLEDTLYPYLNKEDKEYTDVLFNKAKEMEKQQIMDAHLTGLIHPLEIEATKQAEQYYNEIFKQQTP